jgi:hypothetical protein
MTCLVEFASGGSRSSMIERRAEVPVMEAFGRLCLIEQSAAMTVVFQLGESFQTQYDFTVLIPPRSRAAVELLELWLSDEDAYDCEAWPGLKDGLETHRLSARSLFGE